MSQELGFGFGWSGINVGRLQIYQNTVYVIGASGRGEVYTCPSASGACAGNADSTITITKDTTGFTLTRRDGSLERYDTAGLLLSKTDSAGRVTSYTYTSGRLTQITGPYGHTQSFTYTGNHITSVTDASGVYQYAYDANNNLTGVTYPDGSAKRYHYENTAFPNHLTGISYVETNGSVTRYATYSYDASGKAVSTEHAGGAERFTLSYDSDTQTTVRDAVSNAEVMTFGSNLGIKNLVSKVNAGDGKSLVQTFDANNNLTCKQDEEGRVVTYTYNATNQRLSQTEGLSGSCASPTATAATRTTSYSYASSTLDVPTVIEAPSVNAGSRKRTTLVYGDTRFPTLPTAITQSGFTPSATAISRTVTLAYNASGQVTSINGPRTDVNDTTTLSYYTCTTGGACGQLASVTNALGHVTTYDSYDGAGRLLQTTDANGLRTNYGYDARGRVTSITQTPPGGTGRTASYGYNAAGNVTGVTYPDGRSLTYTYNAAQQLLTVIDTLGNRVSYGYDPKGNRTQIYTYDPDGTLVRAIDTAYNLRNHVRESNHGGSVTQHVTDALGNLTRVTDPNQVAAASGISTNHSYDALSRLIQTVDALSGNTSYGYNNQDRLTQVSAPNGAVTQYVYDDLGNLLQETSPDRGTTTYSYDAAGNVIGQTDARGISTSYTYDALNRIVGINYPTDVDVSYSYDSGSTCTNGLGRLCQVVDASGTTQYGYDAFGNVTTQIKTELGRSYSTRYGYDTGDRIISITYPDNRIVSYTRDTLGHITAVSATVNGTLVPIATGRTHRADGLLLSQTYGNGINEVRTYDTQGRLTYQSLGSIDTRVYTYDANGNLKQKQSLPEVGNYSYDLLDRLSDVTRTAITSTTDLYRYDANGNRTQDVSGSYSYLSASNRMTTRPGGTPTLDAAGNTTNDGQGLSLTYNNMGQIATATKGGVTASYTYNHQRQRTRKQIGTQTTVYHYDLNGNLISETDSAGNSIRAYAYADGVPLGQIEKQTPAPYEQIIDNAQASFTGTWPTSTSLTGYYGTNYRTNTKGSGNDKATWTITIPQAGSYQVYARWVANSSHASNAPFSIRHATGTSTVSVSQRTNGGTWRLLGTYTFNSGNTTITLTDKANGTVIADAIRILGTQPNGPTQEVVRYLHTDNLNTPRVATNAQQAKVWSYEGEAFGNTSPTGTVTINLRYAGQYWDAESSLHYNHHRYYSPQLGRYITSDPIGLIGGLNTYVYVNNNPWRWVDPKGLANMNPMDVYYPGSAAGRADMGPADSYPTGPVEAAFPITPLDVIATVIGGGAATAIAKNVIKECGKFVTKNADKIRKACQQGMLAWALWCRDSRGQDAMDDALLHRRTVDQITRQSETSQQTTRSATR